MNKNELREEIYVSFQFIWLCVTSIQGILSNYLLSHKQILRIM